MADVDRSRLSDILAAEVLQLEAERDDAMASLRIYREALFAALDVTHRAAVRLLTQDDQLHQLLDAR